VASSTAFNRPARRAVIALGALAMVAVAGCGGGGGGGGGGESKRLSIATGTTGGVYFVYGGALAQLISSNLDGYEATAEATAASVDNVNLVNEGKSAIAFSLADTASDAVAGKGKFEGKPAEIQALARLYTNYTQVFTTDTKIKTIEDLVGKRVSVGAAGSGTETIALRILEAAKIDPDKDIKRQQLAPAECVQAMKDGTLAGCFWSGGAKTPAITDLATTEKVVLLPTVPYLEAMKAQWGDVYSAAEIPAGNYKGIDEAVPTIGVPNYLVVKKDLSEDTAYQVTKLLFDQKDALAAAHPEAKNLDVERAQNVAPLELHPGAQKYYSEGGN
jgi:TRAP transporter TAXI family solute receptor